MSGSLSGITGNHDWLDCGQFIQLFAHFSPWALHGVFNPVGVIIMFPAGSRANIKDVKDLGLACRARQVPGQDGPAVTRGHLGEESLGGLPENCFFFTNRARYRGKIRCRISPVASTGNEFAAQPLFMPPWSDFALVKPAILNAPRSVRQSDRYSRPRLQACGRQTVHDFSDLAPLAVVSPSIWPAAKSSARRMSSKIPIRIGIKHIFKLSCRHDIIVAGNRRKVSFSGRSDHRPGIKGLPSPSSSYTSPSGPFSSFTSGSGFAQPVGRGLIAR